MAPTVFRQGAFRFFFFSREELRMHVHVTHTDGEAKFWLEPNIELALNQGLSHKQINEALVHAHQEEIINAWHSHSEIEVSLVSNKGFWLLLDNDELFVSYAEFPWFKQATVEQITTIERQSSAHLYWPLLDVDLAVESIRNPASFPLVAKPNPSFQRTR